MEKEVHNMNEEKKELTEEERKELKEKLKKQVDEMSDEELDKVAGGRELGKTYGQADWPVGETRSTFSYDKKSGRIWRIRKIEGNYIIKIHGDWFCKLKHGYKFRVGGNENIFTLTGGSFNLGNDGVIEIGVPIINGVTQYQNIGGYPDITRVE
jgi:hypothetical protein